MAGPAVEGRMHVETITVSVRVHPGASREAVVLLPDGSLDVRLRARAIEGQANAGLVQVLANRLGLKRRDIEIASGMRSRQKIVRIGLASADELQQRLGADHPGVSHDG
jgi:uncharacterized protein (TIGR00251 family)